MIASALREGERMADFWHERGELVTVAKHIQKRVKNPGK